MVCKFGMSDKLGPMTYGKNDENVFLGREFGHQQDYSEDTAREIDGEMKRILTESYELAKRILTERIDVLHRVAEALLEREVLDGSEIDALMRGDTLPSLPPPPPKTSETKARRPDPTQVRGKKIVEPEPMPG
jgi:cell division protease FtsH